MGETICVDLPCFPYRIRRGETPRRRCCASTLIGRVGLMSRATSARDIPPLYCVVRRRDGPWARSRCKHAAAEQVSCLSNCTITSRRGRALSSFPRSVGPRGGRIHAHRYWFLRANPRCLFPLGCRLVLMRSKDEKCNPAHRSASFSSKTTPRIRRRTRVVPIVSAHHRSPAVSPPPPLSPPSPGCNSASSCAESTACWSISRTSPASAGSSTCGREYEENERSERRLPPAATLPCAGCPCFPQFPCFPHLCEHGHGGELHQHLGGGISSGDGGKRGKG